MFNFLSISAVFFSFTFHKWPTFAHKYPQAEMLSWLLVAAYHLTCAQWALYWRFIILSDDRRADRKRNLDRPTDKVIWCRPQQIRSRVKWGSLDSYMCVSSAIQVAMQCIYTPHETKTCCLIYKKIVHCCRCFLLNKNIINVQSYRISCVAWFVPSIVKASCQKLFCCWQRKRQTYKGTAEPLLKDSPNLNTWLFLVSSCSCLCPIHGSQVVSLEWRRGWSCADRRYSNHIWVINNSIVY